MVEWEVVTLSLGVLLAEVVIVMGLLFVRETDVEPERVCDGDSVGVVLGEVVGDAVEEAVAVVVGVPVEVAATDVVKLLATVEVSEFDSVAVAEPVDDELAVSEQDGE